MVKWKKAATWTVREYRWTKMPGDLFAAIEAVAKREGIDVHDVVRTALEHALKAELKDVRKAGPPAGEAAAS